MAVNYECGTVHLNKQQCILSEVETYARKMPNRNNNHIRLTHAYTYTRYMYLGPVVKYIPLRDYGIERHTKAGKPSLTL
jgi:hypothetical protein